MPFSVVEFQPTPNPNALKCVLDRSPSPGGMRSYTSPDRARGDPLGLALLAIPGVRNVLIHDGWISVGKTNEAEWRTLKPAIKKVLGEAS
jgi:hypothetical protein